LSTDEDGDGLPDSWELAFGLDPLDPTDANSMDSDQDLLSAMEEFLAATNPVDPDSDGDGLPDGYELSYGLNPTYGADALLDLDGDGYTNLDEFLAGTDPESSTDFPVIIPPTYTVQIEWKLPTTREDGSRLGEDERAGYAVHYGRTADNMSIEVPVDNPSSTNTQVILTDSGTYYFSIIVIDIDGAESSLSTAKAVSVGQ